MKNALLLSCLFLGMNLSLHAQLPDGSTAPDWTLTDIFGTTHHLYEYLDQGKTVVIDFSATWCGPCWNYHNTHAMKDFYLEHGPGGDDVSMVFYIEGDMSTTIEDLYGQTPQSQGNWVEGTPYSIFNPTQYQVVSDYQISYFPTIYKICPDRKVYEVGQVPAQTFENWIQSCALETDLLGTSNTICYGAGQGAADIDASGGFGSINYSWSNGTHNQDLAGVEAGIYAVSVTEGNGRQLVIEDIEIEGPLTAMEVSGVEIEDVLCHGEETGTLSVSAQGGNGGFSFSWSNGMSGETITNIPAGEYTVTISDSENCTITESFVVEEPTLVEHEIEYLAEHCDQSNGEITVTASGGVPPYSLEASGGLVIPGSLTVVSLASGSYTVTLTDAHGCSFVDEATIENVPGPDVTMPASPTITCQSGNATLNPFILNEGGGYLEYAWSTPDGHIVSGAFDPECVVSLPGTYYLSIEDVEFGCDVVASIVVLGSVEFPEIEAGADLVITCDEATVKPHATVTGEGVFVFEWTTPDGQIISGGSTLDPVFGAPGTYELHVLNTETGCSSTDIVVVADERDLPEAGFNFSAEDLVVAFAAMPNAGSTFHWDFGDGSTSDLQDVNHVFAFAGTYHVCLTVTNACGSEQACKDIVVNSGASVISIELAVFNVSCHGAADGSLSATAAGGSGVYTFGWQVPGGAVINGATITDLAPGSYILTVSDDLGNVSQLQAVITEPEALEFSALMIPPGGPFGPGIDLSIGGGTPGYAYLWSNGATTQDLYRLGTGTYQCTITDENGCEIVTEPIRVVNLKDMTIRHESENVHISGAPHLDPLTIMIDSDAFATYVVQVVDILGRPHLIEKWQGSWHQVDLTQYQAGIYFLTVLEGNTLLKTVRLVINE